MARDYPSRFQCAEPGCTEFCHFTSRTRAEQTQTNRTYYGKWRCIRHQNPEELLTPARPSIVYEIASDGRPHGVYWGHFGFVSGPGFKAFARDFPAGSRLRVTAEVFPADGDLSRHEQAGTVVNSTIKPSFRPAETEEGKT